MLLVGDYERIGESEGALINVYIIPVFIFFRAPRPGRPARDPKPICALQIASKITPEVERALFSAYSALQFAQKQPTLPAPEQSKAGASQPE